MPKVAALAGDAQAALQGRGVVCTPRSLCSLAVAAAAALAVCVGVQAYGMREELTKRFATYHSAETYANQSVLTDPAWETLAQSGRFSHLAFASFDFEHEEFWDLAAFAAENGWTSNSF